jgi:hypothetical protein
MIKILLILMMSAGFVLSGQKLIKKNLICPQKTDPPPVIDGDIDEWLNLPGKIPVTGKDVRWGKSKWKDDDDLSGCFQLCWDANYLYILADVTDEKLLVTKSGVNLYQTDHIEVDIDTDYQPDAKGTYSAKQFLIAFSPGNMEDTGDPLVDIAPEYYIYNPVDIKIEHNIYVASKPTEYGYIIELRIPWKLLKVKPEIGMTIGIDLHLSDSDESENQESLTTLSSGKWDKRNRSKMQPAKLTNPAGRIDPK